MSHRHGFLFDYRLDLLPASGVAIPLSSLPLPRSAPLSSAPSSRWAKWPRAACSLLCSLYQPDARSAARADPLLVLPRAGFHCLVHGVADSGSGWTRKRPGFITFILLRRLTTRKSSAPASSRFPRSVSRELRLRPLLRPDDVHDSAAGFPQHGSGASHSDNRALPDIVSRLTCFRPPTSWVLFQDRPARQPAYPHVLLCRGMLLWSPSPFPRAWKQMQKKLAIIR